jgi:hypothetical protein
MTARGPLETVAVRLRELQVRGLIGEHAIGGAMAFIYWAEPFETKDVDVFVVFPPTESGLLNLAPIWECLVAQGCTPDGQFLRVGRLLVDFVPARDALDEEAIAEAVTVQVGEQTLRVFTPEHAAAIALRTWRGKDREHVDRLMRTGRQPLDIPRLEALVHRYGLEERWRRFKEMFDVDLG